MYSAAVLLARVVDRDHVRVVDRGGRARLARRSARGTPGRRASCGAISFSATIRSRSSCDRAVDDAHAAAAGDADRCGARRIRPPPAGRATRAGCTAERRAERGPGRRGIVARAVHARQRHPRGRLGRGRRRRRRPARPPARRAPAARRDRGGAAAPLALCVVVPALARGATSGRAACRCRPTSRTTRCPTTTPRRSRRGCTSTTRCAIDRVLGLGELPGAAAAAGASARPGASAAREQVLVWCHWLWFLVPHGTALYYLLSATASASRAPRCRSTRSSTSALIGYWAVPDRAAVVRRARSPSPARAPALRRMMVEHGEAFWKERLGAPLQCPRRQPARCHALPALRHVRDGRAPPAARSGPVQGAVGLDLRADARLRARLPRRALRRRPARRPRADRGRAARRRRAAAPRAAARSARAIAGGSKRAARDA